MVVILPSSTLVCASILIAPADISTSGAVLGRGFIDGTDGWLTYSTSSGSGAVYLASTPYPALALSALTPLITLAPGSTYASSTGVTGDGLGTLWWNVNYSAPSTPVEVWEVDASSGTHTVLYTSGASETISGLSLDSSLANLYTIHQDVTSGVRSLLKIPVDGSTPTHVIPDLDAFGGDPSFDFGYADLAVVGDDIYGLYFDNTLNLFGMYRWNGSTATISAGGFSSLGIRLEKGGIVTQDSSGAVVSLNHDFTTTPRACPDLGQSFDAFIVWFTPSHASEVYLRVDPSTSQIQWWKIQG